MTNSCPPLRVVAMLMLLTLCFPALLPAQIRDIRLNPEPFPCTLPPDILIESAAQIDSLVFVVWGGQVLQPDKSAQNVLWGQSISDTTPVDVAKVVHSTQAIPSEVVQVIALQEEFLVVWDDVRLDKPGIYLQRITIHGERIGDEVRISEGKITGMRQIWLHRINEERSDLLWNDIRGTYTQQIDKHGNPIGAEQKLSDKAIAEYLTFSTVPGVVVLQDIDGGGIVIDPNGAISPELIPEGRLLLPYYFSNDQSLLVLLGDTLHHYAHCSDPQPAHTIFISSLREANNNVFRGIIRDSLGRYGVLFSYVYYGEIYLGYYSIAWITDSWQVDTALIEKKDIPGGYGPRIILEDGIDSLIKAQACDNSFYISMYCHYVSKQQQQPITRTDVTKFFQIHSDGTISTLQQLPLQKVLCNDHFAVTLNRYYPDRGTGVVVSIKDKLIPVSVLLPLCYYDINDSKINIVNSNNTLLISWQRGQQLDKVVLGKWENIADEKLTVLSSIPQKKGYNEQFDGKDSYVGRYRGIGVDVFIQNDVHFNYVYSEDQWFGDNEYVIYFPTENQLSKIYQAKSRTVIRSAPYLSSVVSAGYDINTQRSLISIYSGSSTSKTLALDNFGKTLWEYNFAIHQGAIIPGDFDEFFVARNADHKLLHYRSGAIVDTAQLPPTPYPFTCQRLLGQVFLRLVAVDTPATKFILELFNLNGEPRYSTTITPMLPAWHPTVVQYPADGSLMLLWGSPAGVRMCHLTGDLNILRTEFQASEHADTARYPAAAFRNDTLFLVWERTANAMHDLMATILQRNQISDAPIASPPIALPLIRYIHPVPASDQLRVGVHGAGATKLWLYDLRGIHLMEATADAGAQEITVNTSTLTPGIYLLTVDDGMEQERRTVVVIR